MVMILVVVCVDCYTVTHVVIAIGRLFSLFGPRRHGESTAF